MAEVTYFVALPFVAADDGIAAGEPTECFNPNAAVMRAEALSPAPSPHWLSSRPSRARNIGVDDFMMGIVLTAGHARAQRYDPAFPVCLYVVPWGGGSYYRCSYYTMDQCRANILA